MVKSALFLSIFYCFVGYTQSDSLKVIALQHKIELFDTQGENDSVLLYENKILDLSRSIHYTAGIAKSLGSIGTVYMHKGDYPKALNYFFKALTIHEQLKNKEGILVQLGNIGIVYDNQHEDQKALDYYFKALEIAKSIDDKKHISIQYCNIAIIYSGQKKFNDAELYFLKALEIETTRNDKEGIARNLINLGNVNQDRFNLPKALDYFIKALPIAEELKDNYLIVGDLANIGSAYALLKQNEKAENYFIKSLKVAEGIDDLDLKSQVELIISEFYSDVKDERNAFDHYKKYIVLRDSVYNEDNTRKSVKVEMNYEFDKKQAVEKAVHDKQVLLLQAENDLQKQWRLFLIIGIILCLLLLFFVKRAYDTKKRIAEFMGEESIRKEVLLQEVHHRINNNLQIISSLLSLQANSAADEKLHEYLTQSQNRIQSLSVLHELLYQTDSPLKINMKEYLNKVLDFHRDVISTLPAKVDVDLQIAEISLPTKMAVPLALIVNELVTNSIKYAFNNVDTGKITISLFPVEGEADRWQLMVSDTGKGLPVDGQVRKDSLGLRLVTIMSKQLNAVFTKSNSPGATFVLIFKLIV